MNFICQETGESGAERVEAIRLDNFVDGHKIRHIDLLKLDVQGHEHSALLGAEHLSHVAEWELFLWS
jgi:FkbM family methyltransferase